MTDSPLVSYELTGSIATLTMDDGKANVMRLDMLGALADAFDRAEADRAMVVLTGRPGVFSAGYDRAMFQTAIADIPATLRAGGGLVHRMMSFPYPVLAVCTGHAIAQGAFLLLAADVRVGVKGAFKLGLNEVVIGLTIPHYGVEVARHRLAPSWFHHATITGAFYDPDQAVTAGFLDEAVAPDALAERVHAEANRLAALNMAAHHGTKQRVRAAAIEAIRSGVDREFPAPA